MDRDCLINELVCLFEVRGELSPEDNARVEARIAEIREELKERIIWAATLEAV
jgi:hypothetical protein